MSTSTSAPPSALPTFTGSPPSLPLQGGRDIRGWRNRSLILKEIRRAGQISRRGLFEVTGVRPNTVGEIVADLLEEGLVEEVGALEGRRGRRRRLLALGSGGKVLGAELFEGAIRVGSLGLDGGVREMAAHRLVSEKRDEVVRALLDALRPFADGGRVHGIGVAVAGVVDSERGVSRRIAHFEGWKDVPLSLEIDQAFGVPVRLGNLTEVRLVELKHRGVIPPAVTAALVVLEPGAVGCGLVAEGQILRGAVEASSELGQTVVRRGGRWVRLEALMDWTGLCSLVEARGDEPPRDIQEFWEGRSKAISAVREELCAELGAALANVVLLTKPSQLFLTGTLTRHRAGLVEPVTASLRSHLLPAFDDVLSIEVLDQGPADGVRGAGGLILDQLFATPEVRSV